MSEAAPSVLVVEDDPEINALVGAYVELCGYEYRSAHDGHAAIEEVARRVPTAVVLDLMMPGMNGFEVCRHLRDAAATATTPIIILSAMGDAQTRQKTRQLGADEHLVKPFDPDALMTTIKSHVDGSAKRA